MGTRGAYGFYKDKMYKVSYNHWDSYPEGLGFNIVDYISHAGLTGLIEDFNKIELIDPKSKPTKKQIEKCAATTDLNVSEGSTDDSACRDSFGR